MSTPNAPKPDYEGILLVDKPAGCTSHDVVDRVRRTLKMKRIGHAGTLDPAATGLLIILVGKATKVSQYLMSLPKAYEGTLTLGSSTTTQDAEGEVVDSAEVPATLTKEQVEAEMKTFMGDQYQIPPMYSAKKQDGVALYKLARKGQTVERKPRFIHVSTFELLESRLPTKPEVDFFVACSKGVYVRTLANDLGEKLGCFGHLSALRRTAIDSFNIEDAVTLETLQNMQPAEIKRALIPAYQAVPSAVG